MLCNASGTPFLSVGVTVADLVMRNAQGTYWCRECGHHSSSRRDLCRHIEARHVAGDYRCQFCNKSVTTKYNLQRHVNKNHQDELAAADSSLSRALLNASMHL